jgi:hypothetical protein
MNTIINSTKSRKLSPKDVAQTFFPTPALSVQVKKGMISALQKALHP